MKELIIKCDKCQKPGAKPYRYIYDREMDASGNGYNNCYKYLDLCFLCVQSFVLECKGNYKLQET